MFCIEYRGALLEYDTAHLAFSEHFLGTPARIDDYTVLTGFVTLLEGCRHDVLRFKREHCDFGGAASLGNARCIDCDVSAADHYHLAFDLDFAAVGLPEEVDGGCRTGECLSGNSGKASALAADSHVEALVALLAKLGDGDVLSDLYASLYIDADLTHDVYFGLDNVLVKLI